MLADAHGQSYFHFTEPCDVVVLGASLSQSVGSVKTVDRLACEVGPSSHNHLWEKAGALPSGPIMMVPFNSLNDITVRPRMDGRSFVRGLSVSFGYLEFERPDGARANVLFSPESVRVYGFNGKWSRRSVSSLTISEAVTKLIRLGYRSVTGCNGKASSD